MRRSACLTGLVSVALSIWPGAPARAAGEPLPADAVIRVLGHGWGHGRGLGQYGAKGMAQRGVGHRQILDHYYSGISFTTRPAEDIRVRVESSQDIVITSDSPFTARWSNGSVIATSSASYPYMRVTQSNGTATVRRAAGWSGPWSGALATGTLPVIFRPGSSALGVVFSGGSIVYYRGDVEARMVPSNSSYLYAINDLSLEDYLRGVVPREMPASWHSEALRAQAVAARSYTLNKKVRARAKGDLYDICDTTACQVYGGYASRTSPGASLSVREHSRTDDAIAATARLAMTVDGTPILAEFSSSTGGYTANGSPSYQRAVPDPDDSISPYHNWTAWWKVADIERKWPSLGRLVTVRVTKRNGYGDWGGRVQETVFEGTSSSLTLSGNAVRQAFGLRTDWFRADVYTGELAGSLDGLTALSGSPLAVTVRLRNTGTVPWGLGGGVRIAAYDSSLAASDWISPTRPTAVTRNATSPAAKAVYPGQIGEFPFTLETSTLAPGTYTQSFRAVADGVGSMNPRFDVTFTVLPAWVDEAANLLTSGSFEYGLRPWVGWRFRPGDGSQFEAPRHGARALRIAGGTKSAFQRVDLGERPVGRFTLGGWTRRVGTNPAGGPIELRATVNYAGGGASTWRVSFPRSPGDWEYLETTFNPPKPVDSVDVRLAVANQTGEVWADALRLQENDIANPSFERGVSYWNAGGFTASDRVIEGGAADGGAFLRLAGGGFKRIARRVPRSGDAGDTVAFRVWTRAESTGSAAEDAVVASLTFEHTDGSSDTQTFPLGGAPHDWALHQVRATASKPFRTMVVRLESRVASGRVSIDGVGLLPNAVANPGFEDGAGEWTLRGIEDGSAVATIAADGRRSIAIEGGGRPSALQEIALTGPARSRVLVAGWNRGRGATADAPPPMILAVLRYADGSSGSGSIRFPVGNHTWTYGEMVLTVPKAFTRVDLVVKYPDQTGETHFDGLRVITL